MNKYKSREQNTEEYMTIVRAIENTGVRMFMYYPETKTITIPESTCREYNCASVYENMPDSFAEEFVYPEDHKTFAEMYCRIDSGVDTASAIFHSNDLKYCHHVTLTTVTWTEDGRPESALGFIENITDTMKTRALMKDLEDQFEMKALGDLEEHKYINQIASAIGGLYFAIYHINLKEDSYICFREQNHSVYGVIEDRGVYSGRWAAYVDNFVEEEYRREMHEFGDYRTLAHRLRSVEMISSVYRRDGVGWVKVQFIVCDRDAAGVATTVILTVRDVNSEVKLEQQKETAQFEAEHDPLTKLYNRSGFARVSAMHEYQVHPTGFILIDIDNFKALNDCYGHELGDNVLVAVADNLIRSFREEDAIFRLGGDEIAILLYNCDERAWANICAKFSYIHSALTRKLGDGVDVSVTLSAGVCFSKNGYRDDMYLLADEALYATKQNGRASCTMIGENHEIVEQWSDDSIAFHPAHALEYKTSGMFRLEIPADSSRQRTIVCGDEVKAAFGASPMATPEECYDFWEQGIPDEYKETVHDALVTMVREGRAECTYMWNHPQWGTVYVRTNAFGETKNGNIVLTGIHHVLRDTNFVQKKDDGELIKSAMSDMFFSAYYWNLENDTYSTIKAAPSEEFVKNSERKTADKIEEFITYVVDQPDRKGMREFLNPETMQARVGDSSYIAFRYRSISLDEQTQARLIPVKYNAQGKLTHVILAILVLGTVDGGYFQPIDYDRKSLATLYNNVPAGIVMYEWNGKNIKTVRISDFYAKQYGYSLNSDDEAGGGPDFMRVHPDDREGYRNIFRTALEKSQPFGYLFRAWNRIENKYLWVKINAVVKPQSDGTSLVYAAYTDVSEQKLAEQRLEKNNVAILSALGAAEQYIYEYDPVKHTSTCFSDEDTGYELDRVITDYPECFRNGEFIHPDDVDMFIDTVHSIDNGAKEAFCEVRVYKQGKEHWHSCVFHAFYDYEKGYDVGILTIVDVTLNKATVHTFEERFNSLLAIEQNVKAMSMFNLTRNTIKLVKREQSDVFAVDETGTFDDAVMKLTSYIIGAESQTEYRDLFNRDNLLREFEAGRMHVEYDVLISTSVNHYEWITVAVDMVRNPVNEEISGVSYAKSSQAHHMSVALLDKTLKQDYVFAAIVIRDTDEMYLYDSIAGEFRERINCFWDTTLSASTIRTSRESMDYLKSAFVKETMLQYLDEHNEFRYAFDCYDPQYADRLEMNLSYVDPQKTMILATVRNITDALMAERWKYESEHDRLGLLNRDTVFRKCRDLLIAHPDEQFVMLHGDIKHFHLYNTFFGEEAGDELLRYIGSLLRDMDKDYDYWAYGRIESDVFCAFFPISREVFKKHICYLYDKLETYRTDFSISVALGIYPVENPEMSIESMFSRATIAAKSGKLNLYGLVSLYDENMEQELRTTHMVTSEMNTALEEEQFQVYLQPKYSLSTERIAGAEALARWMHPERGLISPGTFIPVIEKDGSIAALDRYMWEHVCKVLRRWMDEGQIIYPVSVNVSRISMYSRETVPFLINLVRKYELEPAYLQLELTESAYMDDPEELKQMLKQLRESGFTILIDDFGSGYSSLNTLRELPVDILKLDRKLLSDSENDKRGAAVLESIVRMSKLLELPIVVEGVEKKSQAEYLQSIGCEYVQGFLFAKPMTVDEYEKLLESEQ